MNESPENQQLAASWNELPALAQMPISRLEDICTWLDKNLPSAEPKDPNEIRDQIALAWKAGQRDVLRMFKEMLIARKELEQSLPGHEDDSDG